MNTTLTSGTQTVRYIPVMPAGAVRAGVTVPGAGVDRQDAPPRRQSRMPNGDPDRLMLWGSDGESGPVGGRR
ncbi:MAG: hypothetical protein A2498_07270 [Lentisphaerae bacterium RIFOXYC12_FULL_60_16]|nr:MAG: hypothetical protein A2498_07270 [Lentisphaerae bacterium RIFOXYC12_FULL_60_16]